MTSTKTSTEDVTTFEELIIDPEKLDKPKLFKADLNDEELLTDLTERFDIPNLNSFSAEVLLTPKFGQVLISGSLTAQMRLSCVVSLDEFDAYINEAFDTYFIPADQHVPMQDLEDEDAPIPEELTDEGLVDVGEFLCQSLALAIPPVPRKPGLELVDEKFGDFSEVEEKPNPFAVLADLKLKSS